MSKTKELTGEAAAEWIAGHPEIAAANAQSVADATPTGAGPTLGPWRVVKATGDGNIVASLATNGARINTRLFDVLADAKVMNGSQDANARLIAAAPTMLAALRDWVRLEDEGMASGISLYALYTRTRAAIRAAEGKG